MSSSQHPDSQQEPTEGSALLKNQQDASTQSGTMSQPPPPPAQPTRINTDVAAQAAAAAADDDDNSNNNNNNNNNNNSNTTTTTNNNGKYISNKTPGPSAKPVKASTAYSWGTPAGLPLRGADDEALLIFRRAVGINSDRASTFTDSETLEKGRRKAVGIYRSVVERQRAKRLTHHTLGVILYASHFAQIVLAATLTALGPNAKDYEVVITVLGAANTVIAGVLAVLKGSGMIERLARDEVAFKKLQDWIEETEAMLSVGIIGRSRREVGLLVEVAFKKYNACFGQAYEIMSSSDIDGSNRDSMVRDAEATRK